MASEFYTSLKPDLISSPSPSEADNTLVNQIIGSLENRESDSSIDTEIYIRLLLAWQTKKLPRYLVGDDGEIRPDIFSGRLWSPSFYRIDPCLKHLKSKLSGSRVLDPFAGSGSLMHTLMAFDIPKSVTLNDISYLKGSGVWSDGNKPFFYCPQQNLKEYIKLFEQYGKLIKIPQFDKVEGYSAQDVGSGLPFGANTFDWIFTDPPYGRSWGKDEHFGLIRYLPEMLRVSRNGILLIMPESWIPILTDLGKYQVENLTGPLVHEKTVFKTVLGHISQ